MRQAIAIIALAASLLLTPSLHGEKSPPSSQPSAPNVTWTGTFNWNGKQGPPVPITAVLTPIGDNEWTAVYAFTWGRQAMTWNGKIKLNAATGEVTGSGNQTPGNRTFAFKGVAKQGLITFTHSETTKGKNAATGNGTFKMPDPAKTN